MISNLNDLPIVSVVIPTYNSEKTIRYCIESIINQTYKYIEIIIIDNFSSDKTMEIVTNYDVRSFEINASRSKARNIGINHSKGNYVLCIDSDMELTNTVVEECIYSFQINNKVGGIIIPERSVGDNFWVKVRDFERSFYVGTEIESARFFKKNLAEQVKGYEEDIVFYEESTLPQRIANLGYNVNKRINSYILHHEPSFNLINWLKKKFYYGKTLYAYSKIYGDTVSRQASVKYRSIIFLGNKKFYSKPILAFGVIILKMLEYLMSSFGYIIGRMKN